MEQELLLDLLLEKIREDGHHQMCVDGRAATGKSRLLQALAQRLRQEYGPSSVVVAAPTRASAKLVEGRTLNSAFRLPVPQGNLQPLAEGASLTTFRRTMQPVKVVLIDNGSLLGAHTLYSVDQRLRQVVGPGSAPFGGRTVVVFTDSLSWRSPIHPEDAARKAVWIPFHSHKYSLSRMHYREASFRKALQRLSEGEVSEEDEEQYAARHISRLPQAERDAFLRDAVVIQANGKDVEAVNANNLRLLPTASFVVHPTQPAAVDAEAVTLRVNARVVFTATVRSLSGEVLAGSMGVVTAPLYGQGNQVEGVSVILDGGREAVSVFSSTEGLPLELSYSFTLNKALGLHFNRVLVKLPKFSWGGSRFMYAAVSRARSWDGLALDGDNMPTVDWEDEN